MTPEEREHLMDFILQSQARSEVRLDRLTESQDRLAASQEKLTASQEKLTESQQRAEDARGKDVLCLDRDERLLKLMIRAGRRARRDMREQDALITTLVDSQVHTEEIARRNSESISELADIVRQLATRKNGNGTKQASKKNGGKK